MRYHLLAIALITCSSATFHTASAQYSALAQTYGKGVHAYYAGKPTAAREYLSMAINSGLKDPRAYYFRGIVAYSQGNTYQAEADWQQGAELEAVGTANPVIGRSLTRFQGAGRLKLEEIRQKARLQVAAIQAARENMRRRPSDDREMRDTVINPQPTPPPPSVVPEPAKPAATEPAADNDPFAGDMAEGEPNVTEEDALEGAMDDPFANEAAAPGDTDAPAAEGGTDPFGTDAEAPADPFGSEPAANDDPFGAVDDIGDDPFAE